MTLHPEAQALMDRFAAAGAVPMHTMGVIAARQAIYEARRLQGEREDMASVHELLAAGSEGRIPVRIYRPHPDGRPPLIVYLHGGGWVGGGVAAFDRWCRSLAEATGCLVASVEYRLAPETRAPGALEDAYAATLWLADRRGQLGADPTALVLAGDSAGGGLAAGTALLIRDRGGPSPSAQLLLYPALDPDAPGDDADGTGEGLSRGEMRWFWQLYLSERARADGYVAPALATDLSGLPPALVVVAEHDVLREEGLHHASRLSAAGGTVTVVRAEGMVHGFFGQLGVVPSARRYLTEVSGFVTSVVGAPTINAAVDSRPPRS